MTFRKEIKRSLTLYESNLLKNELLNKGMKRLFKSRLINSCYLDNNNFDLFFLSNEGVLPRKKIRIRWYDYELKFKKEIKISSIEGRFKSTETINFNNLKEVYKYNEKSVDYGLLKPVLKISYMREYFNYKNLRITLDSNIRYLGLLGIKVFSTLDNHNVLEIKASEETSMDYIEREFALRVIRFSKYSRGIEAVYNL
tara:strand:+ start:13769 stop:14362 length:594 start_codon:yes stop_codon:yes gene_type:complete